MSESEWILYGTLIGATLSVVGAAILTLILDKIVPKVIQWNKPPAIPALIFYGVIAFCGAGLGGYVGHFLGNTPPHERFNAVAAILISASICLWVQKMLTKLCGKPNQ